MLEKAKIINTSDNQLPKVEASNIFDERMDKVAVECRVPLEVGTYSIDQQEMVKSHSTRITTNGVEFSSSYDFSSGTLLRINVFLPNFWYRKRKLVNYQRVEPQEHFRILAKVVKSDVTCKKSRKKLVLAQTVNMDEIDAKVLSAWLQEF